jgi:small subunit ribosomal protein S9
MKNAKQSRKVSEKRAPVARGTGRRKTAVARVWLRPGKGNVLVNGRELNHYFETPFNRMDAVAALRVTELNTMYDIDANIVGGGRTAQAGAMRLGIARALVETNAELKSVLRSHKLYTSDGRIVERKKYGQKGARRKFQFVKR